jgi:hypothetical protein
MLQLDGKYRWTEYRDVPTAARVIEHAPQCSGKFLLIFLFFIWEYLWRIVDFRRSDEHTHEWCNVDADEKNLISVRVAGSLKS